MIFLNRSDRADLKQYIPPIQKPIRTVTGVLSMSAASCRSLKCLSSLMSLLRRNAVQCRRQGLSRGKDQPQQRPCPTRLPTAIPNCRKAAASQKYRGSPQAQCEASRWGGQFLRRFLKAKFVARTHCVRVRLAVRPSGGTEVMHEAHGATCKQHTAPSPTPTPSTNTNTYPSFAPISRHLQSE